jgi:hypothetical protein
MKPLEVIWADLRVLVSDTARVWWRLLPQLLTLQIGGWLGYQATLWLAASMSLHNAWIALGIFALGFVFTLGAIVLSLRLVGRELGIRQLIPRAEDDDDDGRDASVSRLLASLRWQGDMPKMPLNTVGGVDESESKNCLVRFGPVDERGAHHGLRVDSCVWSQAPTHRVEDRVVRL